MKWQHNPKASESGQDHVLLQAVCWIIPLCAGHTSWWGDVKQRGLKVLLRAQDIKVTERGPLQCPSGSEGRVSGAKQGQRERQKLMHRRLHLDMRKDFPVQGPSTGTGCLGRWRFSFTGDIPELSGHNPVLCALGWPWWSRWPTLVPSNLTHSGILWSPLLQCWQCHEKSLLEHKTRVLCSLYIKLNIHTNCNMLGDKA